MSDEAINACGHLSAGHRMDKLIRWRAWLLDNPKWLDQRLEGALGVYVADKCRVAILDSYKESQLDDLQGSTPKE